MAKQTNTQTYRVSNEVDAELRRLAKIHGGIDKALRRILGIETETFDYAIPAKPVPAGGVTAEITQLDAVGPELSGGRGKASTETFRRGLRPKGDTKR